MNPPFWKAFTTTGNLIVLKVLDLISYLWQILDAIVSSLLLWLELHIACKA